ncbi:hypothetical protein [Streptomyces sp. NPDC001985]|uniref:hypothetical protein n=1 Tax=Streptomyces sp. NPDC001985 TaxID=3154406 RepID=UPI00332FC07E
MSSTAWKRAGVSMTAVAVAVAMAGCGGQATTERTVTQVLTAAHKKTKEAKTARIDYRIKMSGLGAEGDGTMRMTGTMGWNPMVMDVAMDGTGAFMGEDPGSGSGEMRMKWVDEVVYTKLDAETAKEMGNGKSWMKMDLGKAAEMAAASGKESSRRELTGGMETMDQDPAQQLALLLDSPNVKRVGEEKIDGEKAQHYRGTLTIDEMMKSNKSLKVLTEAERKKLVANMKSVGIKGYDTDIWVNEDDYPVKMDVAMKMDKGRMEMSGTFTDYGVKADVKAPPAGDTFDMMKMLSDLGKAAAKDRAQADKDLAQADKDLAQAEKDLKETERLLKELGTQG